MSLGKFWTETHRDNSMCKVGRVGRGKSRLIDESPGQCNKSNRLSERQVTMIPTGRDRNGEGEGGSFVFCQGGASDDSGVATYPHLTG